MFSIEHPFRQSRTPGTKHTAHRLPGRPSAVRSAYGSLPLHIKLRTSWKHPLNQVRHTHNILRGELRDMHLQVHIRHHRDPIVRIRTHRRVMRVRTEHLDLRTPGSLEPLDQNQIQDIEPIGGLTSLDTLYASGNQIDDISALETLTQLQSVNLAQNQISSISGLMLNAGIGAGDKLTLITWERGGAVCCLSLIKTDQFSEMVKGVLGPLFQGGTSA